MSFNSLYFILMFLPVTLLAYYAAAERSAAAADWILVGAAVVFYGFTNVWYPVMLGVLMAVNWGITLRIRKAQAGGLGCGSEEEISGWKTSGQAPGQKAAEEGASDEVQQRIRRVEDPGQKALEEGTSDEVCGKDPKAARAWMIAGVAGNIAVLAVFKYTNFFIENLNALLGSDHALVDLILPLGISFIIFGQIAWIVDSYRGSTADVCLREYMLYSSFFPKLSQGPITLPRDFLPQIRKEGRQRFDYENMMVGIQMFVCGLSKKLFLADTLGAAVDWYYDTIQFRSNLDTVIVLLTYTLQIYCDFSGYSDMALGVSRMLGFELPANFDSPYRACSVTEFWKRWHISLTTFLREYIYFPLGGSRKGTTRTYRNIMIVYLVSGFWHGASWSYVLWGVVHGIAQCAERLLGKFYLKIWKPIRWGITFAFVNLAWMIFRSGDLATLNRVWWHLTVDKSGTLSPDLAENYRISGLRLLCSLVHLPTGDVFVNVLSMVLVLGFCLFLCLCLPNNQKRRYRSSALSLIVTAGLLAVCLLSMSSVSTFVYNDF